MRDTVGIRQHNLTRIAQLTHWNGPLSRVDLTEITGLNRSTIADLVAELSDLELVLERAPDTNARVGRPSPIVCANPHVVAIAVNPEVDALTIAAVGLDRHVVARGRIPMAEVPTPEQTAAMIAEEITRWRTDELSTHRIVGVGVAVPGLVRTADGVVREAPHLHWRDVPLRRVIEEATGLPVAVDNDANLGALAEHLFGAARGIDDVIYLNGGASGIGGGVIVNGRPVGGAGGYAGEFGQNRPGIASADDRRAMDGMLEDEVRRSRLVDALGGGELDDHDLAVALAGPLRAEASDEAARQRRILATAIANAVNVLNPARVILGGFLAALAENDLEGLEADVRAQAMSANGEDLTIRPAELADDRLHIGAAELVFAALLRNPSTFAAIVPSARQRPAAARPAADR